MLILVILVITATSIGFFLGCLVKDPSIATDVSLLFFIPFAIFGGFVVNLNDVFPWISWLQYLSPIRYGVEALLRNEFEDNDDYTNGDDIVESYDFNVGLGW